MWCWGGDYYGLPPGPSRGRRATGVARPPAYRLHIAYVSLCHAVASRHSYRVVELAQRVRLPPRCRHPPTLHTFHGDHLVVRVLTPHKADVPQHSSTPTRTPLCTRFTFAMSEGPSEGPSEVCRTAPRAPPCHTPPPSHHSHLHYPYSHPSARHPAQFETLLSRVDLASGGGTAQAATKAATGPGANVEHASANRQSGSSVAVWLACCKSFPSK